MTKGQSPTSWQDGSVAIGVVSLIVTILAGASMVLAHQIHTLQHQSTDLGVKIANDKAGAPQTGLPAGSISFVMLSPEVQAMLDAKQLTSPAQTTATTTQSTEASGNIQNGAITFDKLASANCTSGQVLEFIGSGWACAMLSDSVGITSINGLTNPVLQLALDSLGSDSALNTSGSSTITLSLPTASASARGLLSSTDYSIFNSKQEALTFSTGLNNSSNIVTSTLSTGLSGGQSVIGGTTASNNLTLSSTSNSTKGKIIFGTSAYDEANNRMGIGTTSPSYALDVETTSASGLLFNVTSTSNSLTANGIASLNWSPSSNTTSSSNLVNINVGSHATIASLLNVANNGTSVFKVGQSTITFGEPVTFTSSTTQPVKVVFDSYTVTSNDNVVLAEATVANATITLPNPTSTPAGRVYTIKRIDSPTFTLSVSSAGGAKIDQQSSFSLSHQGNSIELVNDGTNWQILGQWTSSFTYGTSQPYFVPNTGDIGN